MEFIRGWSKKCLNLLNYQKYISGGYHHELIQYNNIFKSCQEFLSILSFFSNFFLTLTGGKTFRFYVVNAL